MALEFFDWKLSWDFQKFYIDLLNCSFTTPPYRENKYKDYLFISKRQWFNKLYEITDFDITDVITVPEWTYLLAIKTDKTKVRIYKEVSNTLVMLYETDFKEWNYERFIKLDYVKWRPRKLFKNDTNSFPNYTRTTEAWKQVEDDTNEPHHYLTDTVSSDDFNTSADDSENWIYWWDYLYVYDYKNSPPADNDWIAWQVNEILSIDNSTTPKKIAVEYPWLLWGNNDWDDMKYVIFPSWWQIFAFVWYDAIYTWHYDEDTQNTTVILRNWQTSPWSNVWISSVTVHKWTINFLTDRWKIFTGRQWYLKMYYTSVDYVDVWSEYSSLASFQDYVLVMWQDAMMLMTLTYDQTNSIYVQQTYDLSSSIWLYDKYSFLNANENFYFISSTRDFYWLSITPAWYDKYVPKYERQSFYITWWLDKLDFTNVNIQKSNTDLYLFVNISWWTHVFIYSFFYGKWLHRELDWEHILNYNNNTGFFYWTNVYNLAQERLDLWTNTYKQSIHFIFWEPTLTTIKNINMLKLIIGKKSVITDNTKVNTIFHYGGYKITYIFDKLKYIDFIEKINLINTTWWIGGSLVWDNTLWTISWITATEELWEIWIAKINLWQMCNLFECKLEADWNDYIEFGWFLLWYKKINPTICNIDNSYVV